MEQLVLSRDEKREKGQFYTPQPIVDYILNFLNLSKEETLLDPSCGCGVFLTRAFSYLLKKYNTSEAIRNIHGVDANKDAVMYTRENLVKLAGERYRQIICKNIRIGNSIYTGKNKYFWNKEFPGIADNGGFDCIIGNPPYFTLRNNFQFDNLLLFS